MAQPIEADVPIITKCIFVLCFVLGFVLQSFWFTMMARGAIKVLFPTLPDTYSAMISDGWDA